MSDQDAHRNALTSETKARIDAMTQEQMASIWRSAPVGHPFVWGETGDYFAKRFKELGGMTPEISKRLGW